MSSLRFPFLALMLCLWAMTSFDAPQAHAVDLVAPTEPLSPEMQRAKFKLPEGFEIQLVVSETDIGQPMNLNFDARGRLWITHSVEYPFPPANNKDARDRLSVIESIDDTGHATKITHFAQGLTIPIGHTPLNGGRDALVYSIPNIYHAVDTDQDGRADQLKPLYGTFGHDDTHGMSSSYRRWFDGWIYGSHGFRNNSAVSGSDGHVVKMNSGNTYRFKSDGSHIEQWTWGQVNPFGMTFDALGNQFNADCHSKPLTMLLRGAYYPSFGKPHDGLGYGPNMIDHSHGSTGICGPAYYSSDHFPEMYRDSLYLCNPVTGRVHRDQLIWTGSSPKVDTQPDFITCEDPWFRPVDAVMGPDGALYIADFYNAIIGHYEVDLHHPKRDRTHGRVWRVIHKQNPGRTPDLTALDAPSLIAKLNDANLIVRTLATHQLVDRVGADAVEPLRRAMNASDSAPSTRAFGLWTLHRLGALAPEHLERLMADPDRLVRVHAIRASSELPQWTDAQRSSIRDRLKDADPFVQRATADAMSQHVHPDQIAALLEAWSATVDQDTHLIHTLRMALRNHLTADGGFDAATQTLVAHPAYADRLESIACAVRDPKAGTFLLTRIQAKGMAVSDETLIHAARYIPNDQQPAFIQHIASLTTERTQAGQNDQSIRCIQMTYRGLRARKQDLPKSLRDQAVQLATADLKHAQTPVIRRGLNFVRELHLTEGTDLILALGKPDTAHGDLRSEALGVCYELDQAKALPVMDALIASSVESLPLRQATAAQIQNLNTPEMRQRKLEWMRTAPTSLAITLASGLAGSKEGAQALIAAIESGQAAVTLLAETSVEKPLGQHKDTDINQAVARLKKQLPPVNPRLGELIKQRHDGFQKAQADVERGRIVFTQFCAVCHSIGGQGNKIGPELDGIGQRGLERVLEDMLDPNRNIDGAFRTVVIKTKGGQIYAGLGPREEGADLIMADATGKSISIPKDQIESRSDSPLSLMPAIFGDAIPEASFYDLLAFLLKSDTPRAAPK